MNKFFQQKRLKMQSSLIQNKDLKWKLTFGVLSLILGALATRLAVFLTDKIWGEVKSLP
jgi:hypothetical protein